MRIVLNADDFGYSPDTLQATAECFERGHLTSASIMLGMPATEDALAFALAHPEYSYGVHLNFVGDGEERPISAPSDVPSLVNKLGRLPSTNAVRVRAVLGRLPASELEREIAAQIAAVAEQGVTVSHVDSHRHLHKYGPFRAALQRVLPHLGIKRVRNVQDMYIRRQVVSPTYWLGSFWRARLMRSFTTTDHFYMATSAGDPDWRPILDRLASLATEATLEVGAHPGYEQDWRNSERLALQNFAEAALEAGHAFVSWSDVPVRS
jgi:predicted glycoside hydrolase/deacetylase ChbG (UPF0249 family)